MNSRSCSTACLQSSKSIRSTLPSSPLNTENSRGTSRQTSRRTIQRNTSCALWWISWAGNTTHVCTVCRRRTYNTSVKRFYVTSEAINEATCRTTLHLFRAIPMHLHQVVTTHPAQLKLIYCDVCHCKGTPVQLLQHTGIHFQGNKRIFLSIWN